MHGPAGAAQVDTYGHSQETDAPNLQGHWDAFLIHRRGERERIATGGRDPLKPRLVPVVQAWSKEVLWSHLYAVWSVGIRISDRVEKLKKHPAKSTPAQLKG